MQGFHYTNLDAVLAILESENIRLTDTRYLNDSQEFLHGCQLLQTAILNLIKINKWAKPYEKDAATYIQNEFAEESIWKRSEKPIFVFSVSQANDRLSQWRSYGSYAIELELDFQIETEYNLLIEKCLYETVVKKSVLEDTLNKAITTIAKEMSERDGRVGILSLYEITKIEKMLVTFKDASFFEEQEIRVVSIPEIKGIKYYSRNNILHPYIEIPLLLSNVKKIIVGPMQNQQLAFESISEYICSHLEIWQEQTGDNELSIEVEQSNVPFRGKL